MGEDGFPDLPPVEHLRALADAMERAETAGELLILLQASDPERLRRIADLIAAFGQPDVDLLRDVADACERDNSALYHERPDDPNGDQTIAEVRALAGRIAALLPPREP